MFEKKILEQETKTNPKPTTNLTIDNQTEPEPDPEPNLLAEPEHLDLKVTRLRKSEKVVSNLDFYSREKNNLELVATASEGRILRHHLLLGKQNALPHHPSSLPTEPVPRAQFPISVPQSSLNLPIGVKSPSPSQNIAAQPDQGLIRSRDDQTRAAKGKLKIQGD